MRKPPCLHARTSNESTPRLTAQPGSSCQEEWIFVVRVFM
jgi:hypothetical protein